MEKKSVDRRSDADIVAASGADPELFGEIFDRHFGAIHRYMQRRVGADPADDLAAETFVTALRVRASYDTSRENARPWLFGIAANLLSHHRRSERRRLAAYRNAPLEAAWVESGGEELEHRVDAERIAAVLSDALSALPDAEREVLLLYAWAELSYGEVAEALEIPVGTVRSRLSRARERLRELISASGKVGSENPVTEGA